MSTETFTKSSNKMSTKKNDFVAALTNSSKQEMREELGIDFEEAEVGVDLSIQVSRNESDGLTW